VRLRVGWGCAVGLRVGYKGWRGSRVAPSGGIGAVGRRRGVGRRVQAVGEGGEMREACVWGE